MLPKHVLSRKTAFFLLVTVYELQLEEKTIVAEFFSTEYLERPWSHQISRFWDFRNLGNA